MEQFGREGTGPRQSRSRRAASRTAPRSTAPYARHARNLPAGIQDGRGGFRLKIAGMTHSLAIEALSATLPWPCEKVDKHRLGAARSLPYSNPSSRRTSQKLRSLCMMSGCSRTSAIRRASARIKAAQKNTLPFTNAAVISRELAMQSQRRAGQPPPKSPTPPPPRVRRAGAQPRLAPR